MKISRRLGVTFAIFCGIVCLCSCSKGSADSLPATYVANYKLDIAERGNLRTAERITQLGRRYGFQVDASPIPDGMQFQAVFRCGENFGALVRTMLEGHTLGLQVFQYAFKTDQDYEDFIADAQAVLNSAGSISETRRTPTLDDAELAIRHKVGRFAISPRCASKVR